MTDYEKLLKKANVVEGSEEAKQLAEIVSNLIFSKEELPYEEIGDRALQIYNDVRAETRNERDVSECFNEETGEFDWDKYQYLCDISDYWDCSE